MGNIGYIFGYAVIFAFLLGAIVGYIIRKIGDKSDKCNSAFTTPPLEVWLENKKGDKYGSESK